MGGYLWLAQRPVSAQSRAVTCAPGGTATATDRAEDVAHKASNKPDLLILADYNLPACGCVPSCYQTFGCWTGNHPGSGLTSIGVGNNCQGLSQMIDFARPLLNPDAIPLGVNTSRLDARTTWTPIQDMSLFRYLITGRGGQWHSW